MPVPSASSRYFATFAVVGFVLAIGSVWASRELYVFVASDITPGLRVATWFPLVAVYGYMPVVLLRKRLVRLAAGGVAATVPAEGDTAPNRKART